MKNKINYKKYIPDILTVASICGVVATVITTSKSTLKVEKVLKEISESNVVYNNEKEELIVKMKAVTPHIILPIMCSLATIASIVLTNKYNKKQMSKLIASYALLSNSYMQYQKSVKNNVTEDLMKKINSDFVNNLNMPEMLANIDNDTIIVIEPYTGNSLITSSKTINDAIQNLNDFYKENEYLCLCDVEFLINGNDYMSNSAMNEWIGWSKHMITDIYGENEYEPLKIELKDTKEKGVYILEYNHFPEYGFFEY